MSDDFPVIQKPKKILQELERECLEAYNLGLFDEYTCNPYLTKAYIFVRFHSTTPHPVRVTVAEYIKVTYNVDQVNFVDDGDAIYITYDYWSRYKDQNDDDGEID